MPLDSTAAVYVTLDVVSCAVALVLAFFFDRAHRLVPSANYAVLGVAFVFLGAGYLTVAISALDIVPEVVWVKALRNGGLFAGALLIFLNYVAVGRGVRGRTLTLAAIAVGATAALYVLLYALGPALGGLPDPLTYLPWLRLVEGGLLSASASIIILRVQSRAPREYLVPFAFSCMALSRLIVAAYGFAGQPDALALPYLLRLVALGALLSLVAPSRRWADAPA